MTQTNQPKERNIGIVAHLRELLKRPNGVHAPEVQGYITHNVQTSLWHLANRGEAFRARVAPRCLRFFDTAERAAAYEEENRGKWLKPSIVRAPVELAEDRAAARGSARDQRAQAALKLRANATAVDSQTPRPPVRITYGPTPTTGPLSGSCPPDRPLVLRPGALDYQRHMVKFNASARRSGETGAAHG